MSHVSIAIDSEFQSLIPPLTDDEYQRLEKSILAEGVREPIITWNGTIIDGHNRYNICQEHGIEFTTVEREFASRDAAKIWIIENQFGRRNLSAYDRSVLALELEPLYKAEAERRHVANGGDKKSDAYRKSEVQNSAPPIHDTGKSRDKLADLAGVSHDTIRKVKAIEQAAQAGNPKAIEVRDELRSGEKKSIHGAYVAVVGKPQPRRLEETVAEDGRRVCVMCGEPIDDGDALPSRPTVHKKCEKEYQQDWERSKKLKVTAEDGRRICSICGEPIDDGDAYPYHPTVHKKCHNAKKRTYNGRYDNPDKSLLENVPTYTIESLLCELTASAENMREAMEESIAINESMGVHLTNAQRKKLDRAILHVLKTIQKIGEEADNG